MLAFNTLKHTLTTLRANDEGFISIHLPLSPISLLAWLKAQQQFPQIYLGDKNHQGEVACLGCAWQTDTAHIPATLSKARLYGGMGFSASSQWPDFPHCQFILPRIEIRRQGKINKLICNLYWAETDFATEINATLALLANLSEPSKLDFQPSQLISRQDLPNQNDWSKLVRHVTKASFQQHTAKVVLSRQTKLTLANAVDHHSLLHQWQALNPNCFSFLISWSAQAHFLGCTPERLYLRSGARLTTESLAGTMPRGSNQDDDQEYCEALLHQRKFKRENQLVLEDILAHLKQVSYDIGLDTIGVLKLNHIQHLKQRIHAYLKPEANDYELLSTLHPTPAVGGTPRENALQFINQHEPYQRGWYAGAIGVLNQQQSQFAVAIRSALVRSNEVCLFAGAGIVKGSLPEHEWLELEHKIATPLQLLTVSVNGKAP
ncbi:isochorismate synthase MenF [Motilimonas sp. KMU-193]|uniref:isochorismate synthase n=1 Tax=Motilimonas sp. KMU-193 TaxID=3388668 RepID=UPI00396B41D5